MNEPAQLPAAEKLKSPFPWFGGKSRAAKLVWEALGDVENYVEPFAGSCAVLLSATRIAPKETVNDRDGYIANFWRAVKAAPGQVAMWADWPVNEVDLEARHAWLVARSERLRWCLEDPDYFDAKIAGYWVWGQCAWIGSGWCAGNGPHRHDGAHFDGNAGRGINRKLPHLGDAGRGINRQLPHLGNAGQGIEQWLVSLSDRLRRTRVACGSWERVLGNSTIRADRKDGITGVFLDPPYGEGDVEYSAAGNATKSIAADVWEWAKSAAETNAHLRIVVAAYDDGRELPDGWTALSWKGPSGYSKRKQNRHHETLYLSPLCLRPSDA